MASTEDISILNPNCASEIMLFSASKSINLLFKIEVNSFPKQLTRVIPL